MRHSRIEVLIHRHNQLKCMQMIQGNNESMHSLVRVASNLSLEIDDAVAQAVGEARDSSKAKTEDVSSLQEVKEQIELMVHESDSGSVFVLLDFTSGLSSGAFLVSRGGLLEILEHVSSLETLVVLAPLDVIVLVVDWVHDDIDKGSYIEIESLPMPSDLRDLLARSS